MKKKLFALLLALVLVVSVTVISAMAEETTTSADHANHCVCGGNRSGRGDHTQCTAIEDWQELTVDCFETYTYTTVTDNGDGTTTETSKTVLKIKPGSYYLTKKLDLYADVSNSETFNSVLTAVAQPVWIMPGETVNLCLNGFELKHGRDRSFNINGTLNVTDCSAKETGRFCGAGKSGSVAYAYAGGQINVYAGSVISNRAAVLEITGAGVFALSNDQGRAEAEGPSSLTLYGGSLKCRTAGVQGNGGAVSVWETSTFTMYGGNIQGGNVTGHGGAIYSTSTGDIKLLGGKIYSGQSEKGSDGVYAPGVVTLGGAVTVEELYLKTGGTVVTENLTGSVGLATPVTNSAVLTTCTEAEAACFTSKVAGRSVISTEVEGAYQITLGHAAHCVCGGNLTDAAAIAAHGQCTTVETWMPLTAAIMDDVYNNTAIPENNILGVSKEDEDGKGSSAFNRFLDDYDTGHFYLTENISYTYPIDIHTNDDITICLNGYTLSCTNGTNPAFRVWGKLTICDCTGEGHLTGKAKGGSNGNGAVISMRNDYADATNGTVVNIYGGTVEAKDTDNTIVAGTIAVGTSSTVNPAVLNIYGGTITGGKATQGGNIYINAGAKAAVKDEETGEIITPAQPSQSVVNMYGGAITNGQAKTRGGNVYVNHGAFNMYGGTVTGGTLAADTAEYGADIAMGAPNAHDAVIFLDGAVTVGEIGAYGSSSENYSVTLGDNFSVETPIKVSAANLSKIIKNVSYDVMAYFEAASETEQVAYEEGDIWLRAVGTHYTCICGGTYSVNGSSIDHTCSKVSSWVAVNSEFLANSATTTETVTTTDETTGETTSEEVTTITGWGSPVTYTSASAAVLNGTFYEIPSGYYYLTEDITLEHGMRVVKGADVKIDLNGHTITAPANNARAIFLQGNLRICDSSYDATKENKAEQFHGAIVAARAVNYGMAYISASGQLRIYGGNYYSTADCSANTQGMIASTGTLHIFDGYLEASDMNGTGALVNLQVSGNNAGSLSVRRATLVGARAKNGGIIGSTAAGTSINIYSGNLIGSEVSTDGGAIYSTKGSVQITGGTITGGTAVRGGNICVGADASLKITNGTIKDGTAVGAASGTNGGGGNIYATCNVEISGGTISGGTATRTQSSAHAYGGNIYLNTTSKSLTISNGTIDGGTAITGGNIFVRGTFEMTGGTISNGIAAGAIAGNVRVEGSTTSGTGVCNITGGTFIGGTAVDQGGSLVLRNLPGESIIKNASFTGGVSTGSHGGNIYMTGIAGNVIMENVTIADGVAANRAGNLYITAAVEGITANLTNVTMTGGQTVDRGGNMYFADVACTMTDCTVTGGAVTGSEGTNGADVYGANIATNTGNFATSLVIDGGNYGGLGENNISLTSVHVLSSDDPYTITVTGAPVIDDLRLGTDRMLTVGELTEGANIGISRFEITGIFAPGAAEYAQYFTGVTEGTSVVAEGEDLVLVSSMPYWALDALDNVIAPANTIAEAMALENASFVRLVSDFASTETYTGDLYLDLFGHDLSGLTVNGNLYVVDYATNDYEEGVAGSFSGTVSGSINDGLTVYSDAEKAHFNVTNKYVKIANEDGSYGFHRVTLNLTHISLKPAADALGFKATVYGDSAVQAAITGYGFNMGVEGGNLIAYTKNEALTEGVFTLRLQNILKNNGGEMTIVGEPVIFFGEESVSGGTHTTTMKSAIETIEATLAENAEAYTQTQIEAVQALIAQYESKMSGWDIDTIKAWVPSTEEETPAA